MREYPRPGETFLLTMDGRGPSFHPLRGMVKRFGRAPRTWQYFGRLV